MNHENTRFSPVLCHSHLCSGSSESGISVPENFSRQRTDWQRRTGRDPNDGRHSSGPSAAGWTLGELPPPSGGVWTQHSSRRPGRPTRLVPLIFFQDHVTNVIHAACFVSSRGIPWHCPQLAALCVSRGVRQLTVRRQQGRSRRPAPTQARSRHMIVERLPSLTQQVVGEAELRAACG